jgi:hypothetical protein
MALCNGSTGWIFSLDEWGVLTVSANIILLNLASGSLVI